MSDACGNREERLVSLLYEDGDPSYLAEIRAHVATCASCRGELEQLASTRELLGAWPDAEGAPRIVLVSQPVGSVGHDEDRPAPPRQWGPRRFLPVLAGVAAVGLVLVSSALLLRFQVGADGRLRVGFGTSYAPAGGSYGLVTRADLDQSLARTAEYLEAMVRDTRQQDRQALLDAVDEALRDQDLAAGKQVANAINWAFEEADRRRRADLGVMLSSMNDLQVITRTELQQLSAMLASLAPAPER